jgi:hypothetical protein
VQTTAQSLKVIKAKVILQWWEKARGCDRQSNVPVMTLAFLPPWPDLAFSNPSEDKK